MSKSVDRQSKKTIAPELTAFNSPRLPHLAKCALKLALELPAQTPHRALSTLEKLSRITLGTFGRAGDRQSRIIAVSLNMSAASLYILHSGSSDVPSLCANAIVAIRPMLSWSTESSSAAVGEAEASPTPTPVRSSQRSETGRFSIGRAVTLKDGAR